MRGTEHRDVQQVVGEEVVTAKVLKVATQPPAVGGVGRYTGTGRLWEDDDMSSAASGMGVIGGVTQATGARSSSSGAGAMTLLQQTPTHLLVAAGKAHSGQAWFGSLGDSTSSGGA